MKLQAPPSLSESWDNTGLLLGNLASPVQSVQTCLTLTHESANEAIAKRANLVIAHHPLPFKPVSRITTEDTVGELIWNLASHRISVYSPHTAWDSAPLGINRLIADRLELRDVQPLTPAIIEGCENVGAGRVGQLNSDHSMDEFCELVRSTLPNCRLRGVESGNLIRRVAIACGSGASLLGAALRHNIDLFLSGEATFHNCLEAKAAGVSMLLVGHFASEQFAMVELAKRLSAEYPSLKCWASQDERDPVRNFPPRSELP
jgi:dinuclear metal center YbgI/SA1388 family protein